jgi:toxin CcdB
MAQFDVCQQKGRSILLVDCQNDYLSHLSTRFVIPLIPMSSQAPQATLLNPVLSVNGEAFVLSPNAAATIPVQKIGTRIASLMVEQDRIEAAIDRLVTGF